MTEIYLVQGDMGQWSDFTTWPVRAFATAEEAAGFIALLIGLKAQIEANRPALWSHCSEWVNTPLVKSYPDPGFEWEYFTDTPNYTMKKVPFGP